MTPRQSCSIGRSLAAIGSVTGLHNRRTGVQIAVGADIPLGPSCRGMNLSTHLKLRMHAMTHSTIRLNGIVVNRFILLSY
jgi:hypothetical protein